MDYYNHLQRDNYYKDELNRPNFPTDEKKIEQLTIQQIEIHIQQQVNIYLLIFFYFFSNF